MDKRIADEDVVQARRCLKRFTTEGVEKHTKSLLKRLGWIEYSRIGAFWRLTNEGKAEAERLGYL